MLTNGGKSKGSGKSSLLKIIAGVDTDFDGVAKPLGGAKIGYLPQEPVLDPTKTVKENILLGVRDKKATLDRYRKVLSLFSPTSSQIHVHAPINPY